LPRLKASAGGKEVPKEYKDKLTTLVKELEKATADLENQERKTLADDVIKQIAKIKVVKKPEAEVKKERETIKEKLLNIWNSFTKGKTEEGKVKFGAIDQNNKISIKGNLTPFKLRFSTIGNGVDILTSVKVSPTMDASSSNGTQLGINLNTTQIKLTGYKNF
jgi:hypothetical protein